jgi:hypothetical protein
MSNITTDKQYRTRDGREVRILCTDGRGPAPVVGFIMAEPATVPRQWYPDGRFYSTDETPLDLVPAPCYRAWRHGEPPKMFMAKRKFGLDEPVQVARYHSPYINLSDGGRYTLDNAFGNIARITESGNELPCGVEE